VYAAARVVPPPTQSFAHYLGWWGGLSGAATLVLLVAGRISRRLLPLAALLRLSLVFPDGAPSRFRTALESGTVTSLEQRLQEAKQARDVTSTVAAQRLLALVALLDTHDSLTRGHSERVRAYAQMIGRELGLNRRNLELLNWAAVLHDVGKLEVPREILTKAGRPTDAEWAILRRHPEFGAELVEPLRPWLGEWCNAVSDHHERWDGTGYPNGTAGKDISLGGRIVAVADVFDVITSSRTYKQASPAAQGRKEIARCAGTQFDPEIVRAFLGTSLRPHRIATGPLAWLGQGAVLARIPIGGVAGSLSAAAVAVGANASVGLAHPHHRSPLPPAAQAVAAEPAASRETRAATRGRETTVRSDSARPARARRSAPRSKPVTGSNTDPPPSLRSEARPTPATDAPARAEESGGSSGLPSVPSTQSSPSAPAAPSTPTSASAPAAPSTPSTPSLPTTPTVPTPRLPDVPPVTPSPSVPSLPAPAPSLPAPPTPPVSIPSAPLPSTPSLPGH
jgi:putative nucleotidyltransferase with HDIG domain